MIRAAGDSALIINLGNEIDEEINKRVLSIAKRIEEEKIEGVREVVPTYTSICVYYDPLIISYEKLKFLLKNYLREKPKEIRGKIVEIPVIYGGKYGPDIEFVANYNGLSVDDVIEIHTKPLYRVYMLGFLPGFAYLGGMDERIATPRLKTPRTRVLAGSVGIAGKQTGWYAIESPGGWRIIGRTPIRTFNPNKKTPSIVLPGDYVKFKAIEDVKEYEEND